MVSAYASLRVTSCHYVPGFRLPVQARQTGRNDGEGGCRTFYEFIIVGLVFYLELDPLRIRIIDPQTIFRKRSATPRSSLKTNFDSVNKYAVCHFPGTLSDITRLHIQFAMLYIVRH